jgi:Ca-activated chloride channel family protein
MSPILLNTALDYELVDFSKESEICADLILMAPENNNAKRLPLNLVLALDASGSMAGDKLESVKRAVNLVIDHLVENDGLNIIGFSDNVWDIFSSKAMTQASKNVAKQSVNNLHSHASTNISQALIMAMEKAGTALKDVVTRIVLLTDGCPTSGECQHELLVKMVGNMNSSISLSCFGFGSDYNPELLTSLANVGRGGNFYIEKDEDCRTAFAMELGGLLSLFAQDIQMTIIPNGNASIKEFMSQYSYEKVPGYRGLTEGKLTFCIPDIFVGEKKHTLIKFSVPSASEAVCARKTSLFNVEIDYLDAESKDHIKISGKAQFQYVRSGKIQKEQNPEVKKQMKLAEIAKMQIAIKEKADAGDYQNASEMATSGLAFITSNAQWFDNAPDMERSFANLAENTANRVSYVSTGSKQAASYIRGLSSNRAASLDMVGATYSSSIQQEMVRSFMSTSGTGSGITVGDQGTSSSRLNITVGKTPDEDEKDAKV